VLLDRAAPVTCSLDFTGIAVLPKQVRIELVPGDRGKLRVRGRPGEPALGDWAVLVDPARERELEVVGAQSGAEFQIRIVDDTVVGEVPVVVTAGTPVAVTVCAQPAGRLVFACRNPAEFDLLIVHWRRPDGEFSSVLQVFGCKGRKELGPVVVPAGTVAWRIGFAVPGKEPQRREGTVVVSADGVATAVIE
jgi:hypothetical protein